MKIVILGYGKLAQAVLLGTLQSKHEIAGVFRWEKERPNKFTAFIRDIFMPDALTTIIKAENLPEINAKNTKSRKFIKQLKKIAPDVIIVSTWGERIKKEILEIPKVACVNCHPSLLPAHRGSNPYISVLRQGEKHTGVTFHLMDEDFDTGDILLQEKIPVSINDTAEDLKQKCAFSAKQLVPALLNKLEKGELIPQKQDEEKASYFPPIHERDVIIDWEMSAEYIHNQIRAFSPKTGCYTLYKNEFLFIRDSEIINLETPSHIPGMIIKKDKKSVLIATGEPDKAIRAGNLEVYGFLSKFWSQFYIDSNLREKTSFNKIQYRCK